MLTLDSLVDFLGIFGMIDAAISFVVIVASFGLMTSTGPPWNQAVVIQEARVIQYGFMSVMAGFGLAGFAKVWRFIYD